jgi:hypothetical protein
MSSIKEEWYKEILLQGLRKSRKKLKITDNAAEIRSGSSQIQICSITAKAICSVRRRRKTFSNMTRDDKTTHEDIQNVVMT